MRKTRGQGNHQRVLLVEDVPDAMLSFNGQPDKLLITKQERLNEGLSTLDWSMDFL